MKSLITHLNFSALTKVSSTAVSSKLVLAGFALILAGCPAKEETGGRIFDSVDGQAVPDAGEVFERTQAAADAESKRKIEEQIATGALSREQQFELEKLDREISAKKAETEAQTANLRGAKDEASAKEKTKQVYKEQDTKLMTSLAATGVDAAKALGDYKNGKDEAQAAKDRAAAYKVAQNALAQKSLRESENLVTREEREAIARRAYILDHAKLYGDQSRAILKEDVETKAAIYSEQQAQYDVNKEAYDALSNAAAENALLNDKQMSLLRDFNIDTSSVPFVSREVNGAIVSGYKLDEGTRQAVIAINAQLVPQLDEQRLNLEAARRAAVDAQQIALDAGVSVPALPDQTPGVSFKVEVQGGGDDDGSVTPTPTDEPSSVVTIEELKDARAKYDAEKKRIMASVDNKEDSLTTQQKEHLDNLKNEYNSMYERAETATTARAGLEVIPGYSDDGFSMHNGEASPEFIQAERELAEINSLGRIEDEHPTPTDVTEILDMGSETDSVSIPEGEVPVDPAGGPTATVNAEGNVSSVSTFIGPPAPPASTTPSTLPVSKTPTTTPPSNSVEDIQAALANAIVSGDEDKTRELQSLLNNQGVSNLSGGSSFGGVFDNYQNAALSCTKREVASECDSLVPQVDSNFDKARGALASLRGDNGPMSDATRAQALSDLVDAQNALRAVASRFAELSNETTNSVSKVQYANSYSVINAIAADLGKAISAYQAGETYNSSQLEAILTARYDDLEYRHGEIEGVSLYTPQNSEDSSTAYAQGDQAIINALHNGGFDAFAAEIDRQKNLRD